MRIRSEFEERFPLPKGIRWSDELGSYCIYDRALAGHHSELIGYQSAWAGWHESRATLTVRLPDTRLLRESAAQGNAQSAIRIEQQELCRVAILNAGLKAVEPSEMEQL